MNYLKKSVPEKDFQIKEFFKELGAQNKKEGDKMFKKLIEEMLHFRKTVKTQPLISFARSIKELEFDILESEEAYEYWSEITNQRAKAKRVYAHYDREEQIADEIIKVNKKQKPVEEEEVERVEEMEEVEEVKGVDEEEDVDNEARASPSTNKIDIWSAWSDFFHVFVYNSENYEDINNYSLENLGIVQLGHKIGSKQTRAIYPKKLVDMSNKILDVPKQNILSSYKSLYDTFFLALRESLDNCHEILLRNTLRVYKTDDCTLKFSYEFFLIFVTQFFPNNDISKLESVYNFRVIFRFLDTVSSNVVNCQFIPGETRLQAIKLELERRNLSTKNYYNADGIIHEKVSGLELVLLETSGPFKLEDTAREATDHIKAAYGLVAMLHAVAYQYIFADIKVFKQLKVCFLHAANSRIRLWTFSLAENELYVLNRVGTCLLPSAADSDSEDGITSTINLMWQLKELISEAVEALDRIKQSHHENKKLFEEGSSGSSSKTLDSYLVYLDEVKLSSSISETEDIYMFSSPLQPDSPNSSA